MRIGILTRAEHIKLRRFLSEWLAAPYPASNSAIAVGMAFFYRLNWLLWGSSKYVIVNNWWSQRLALKYWLADNWYTRLRNELIILRLDRQWLSQITEGIVLVFNISLLWSSYCYLLIC